MTRPAVLPWPHRDLHPNARKDRRHITATRQKAKQDAHYAAKEAGWVHLPDTDYDVHMVFHPPDRRHRDLDGMFAAMKYPLDALAEVLNVDDRRFGFVIRKGLPTLGGAVVVQVWPRVDCKPIPFQGSIR